MPVPLFLLPPSAQCVCVRVPRSNPLLRPLCPDLLRRIFSQPGSEQKRKERRRRCTPTRCTSYRSYLQEHKVYSGRTRERANTERLSPFFYRRFSLSSLRRAILHLRLGLPSLDRSVSNLDTLLPERSLLSSGYQRGLLAREFHRRSDRFRG